MIILKSLYGEAGESVIAKYHDSEPYPENPNVSIFATGHIEYFPFSQTTISSSDVEGDQEKIFSERWARGVLQHWQAEEGKVGHRREKEKTRHASRVSR
jgi:hypothetical protein